MFFTCMSRLFHLFLCNLIACCNFYGSFRMFTACGVVIPDVLSSGMIIPDAKNIRNRPIRMISAFGMNHSECNKPSGMDYSRCSLHPE